MARSRQAGYGWQAQLKTRPALPIGAVSAAHAAAVVLGNAAHQGQPQPYAAAALTGTGQAVELVKNLFAVGDGYAGASVLYAQQ